MNVTEQDLVIVRGINQEWISENFTEMWIGFGGSPIGVPKKDARFIGLYLGAPISAITHIGIVNKIERYDNNADFYLKAIIKLDQPVNPGHQIRKHEYWNLSDFGLSSIELKIL